MVTANTNVMNHNRDTISSQDYDRSMLQLVCAAFLVLVLRLVCAAFVGLLLRLD